MNIKDLQGKIYHNIFYISLYISLVALILYLFSGFMISFPDAVWYTLYGFDFSTVDLLFFNNELFVLPVSLNSTFAYKSVLNLLFLILFLAGAILYKASDRKEKRLLDFSFSILFIAGIISLLSVFTKIFVSLVIVGTNFFETYSMPLILLFIIKLAVTLFVSYTYLQKSFKEKKYIHLDEKYIEIYKKNNSNETILEVKGATKFQRFGHYFIDNFMIIALFSKFIFLMPNFIESLTYFLGDRLVVFLIYFLVGIFYYLLFEGIFKATPGKYLMNTSVQNFNSKKLSFMQIIIRTICRRIPFEAFSFLNTEARGWHDQLSSTAVVQHESDKKYEKITNIILVITILILIMVVILNFI